MAKRSAKPEQLKPARQGRQGKGNPTPGANGNGAADVPAPLPAEVVAEPTAPVRPELPAELRQRIEAALGEQRFVWGGFEQPGRCKTMTVAMTRAAESDLAFLQEWFTSTFGESRTGSRSATVRLALRSLRLELDRSLLADHAELPLGSH